jgi:hypothetical protein
MQQNTSLYDLGKTLCIDRLRESSASLYCGIILAAVGTMMIAPLDFWTWPKKQAFRRKKKRCDPGTPFSGAMKTIRGTRD